MTRASGNWVTDKKKTLVKSIQRKYNSEEVVESQKLIGSAMMKSEEK